MMWPEVGELRGPMVPSRDCEVGVRALGLRAKEV